MAKSYWREDIEKITDGIINEMMSRIIKKDDLSEGDVIDCIYDIRKFRQLKEKLMAKIDEEDGKWDEYIRDIKIKEASNGTAT